MWGVSTSTHPYDKHMETKALQTRYNVSGTDEKLCIVTYAAYHDENSTTDVRTEVLLRGSDQTKVTLNANPFRYMRNAFVGGATLDPPEELTAEFEELLDTFLNHHKGAMQVGIIRLRYKMDGWFLTFSID